LRSPFHQGEAGALDGHVGASAHGDADVGLRQCRRIVDAVAGHRHLVAFGLQILDDACLVRGQYVGTDFVDAQAAGDGTRRAFVVAGGHDDRQALGVQRLECFGRLSLTGSATLTRPAISLPIRMNITVSPSSRRALAASTKLRRHPGPVR
jgi:hypothetical protein